LGCAAAALFLPTLLPFNRAEAQSVLPKGIGVIRLGYRQMSNPSMGYDAAGDLQNLGHPYRMDFTGPEMLKGKMGEDAKLLAEVLSRFDSESTGNESLLERLTLGSLDPKIDVKMSAYTFALAYGVSNAITAYLGVPLVNVQVNAGFSLSGPNNALEIKQELGELGFDELKAGLDTASQLNSSDLIDVLADSDYSTDMTWTARQPGDSRVGIYLEPLRLFDIETKKHESTFNLELNIPTGYRDRPERLIDTTLGRGAYALYAGLEDKAYVTNLFWLYGLVAGVATLPTKIDKRVPTSGSSFVPRSREKEVTWSQGFEWEGRAGTGLNYSLLDFGIQAHYEEHLKDKYSGELAGNYDKLAEGSDWNLLSVETGLTISTVNLYKTGAFAVPFLARFLWKQPVSGKNKVFDQYFELTLTSFFSTPFSAPPIEETR
jgi:hypothetical protein